MRTPSDSKLILSNAVAVALYRFQPGGEAVSIKNIRDAVRRDCPECTLSEVMLNKYIGDQAINGGFNVHFDAGAPNIAV